jgi:D-serine dehydratase
MNEAIQDLLARPLEQIHKALPPGTEPFSLAEIGRRGWNALAGDLPLPLMVLKESALTNNIDLMATFGRDHGLGLAPHGKTTMSPQLVHRQISAGAWGVTTATPTQAAVYHEYGVSRIILANQLLDPVGVRWVSRALADDPGFEFYCLVDSVHGVELLDRLLKATPPPSALRVLVELGSRGKRAGCRSIEEALAVASAVSHSNHVSLAGIEAFEGVIGTDRTAGTTGAVRRFLIWFREVAERMMTSEHFVATDDFMVTIGGSAFPDLVAEQFGIRSWAPPGPCKRILRSGCYLTHDHGLYAAVSPFDGYGDPDRPRLIPALEVWGVVLSRPEPELAIVGFGKRDVPYDSGFPVPIAVCNPGESLSRPDTEMNIVGLNDQHAMVHVPRKAHLEVGQLLGCGISHPCTAFDKWTLIPLVDDAYGVVGAVRTFF